MTTSSTAGRQHKTDDTKSLLWALCTECDITSIVMVGMRRTSLSITIPAHNVSRQPDVLHVDGAVFVTLNRINYHSY